MATGPGPDTKLSKPNRDGTRVIEPDLEKKLAADKVILYGDAATGAHQFESGKKVLVSGGGATSAWGASRAHGAGNDVDWVSRVPAELQAPLKAAERRVQVAEQRLANLPEGDYRAARYRHVLKQAQDHQDRLLRQSIIKNENGEAVDGPFKNSDLARNKTTLDNPDIRRQGKEIAAVSERMTEGEHAGKVKVKFSDGSEDYYDHIVVGHGQDPSAPGGVHNVLDPVLKQGGVKPIYDQGGEDYQSGKLLGLQSGDSDEKGGIRILGAASSAPGFDKKMDDSQVPGFKQEYKQRTEGDGVSSHSKKVGPGIEPWSDTWARVNQNETDFPGQKKANSSEPETTTPELPSPAPSKKTGTTDGTETEEFTQVKASNETETQTKTTKDNEAETEASTGTKAGADTDAKPTAKEPPKGHYWTKQGGKWVLQRTDAKAFPQLYEFVDGEYKPRPDGRKPDERISISGIDKTLPKEQQAKQAKEQAFEQLSGNDSEKAFGKWVKVVTEEGVGFDDAQMRKQLGLKAGDDSPEAQAKLEKARRDALVEKLKGEDADGKTHTTARGDVKEGVDLLGHIRNEERLAKLVEQKYPGLKKDDPSYKLKMEQVEFQEMLRITTQLGPADQGAIVEQWYQKRYGQPDDKTQVPLDKDTYGLSDGRRPDRFEPNPKGEGDEKTATLRDIKSTKDALTNPDVEQLEDSLKLAKNSRKVDDHTISEVSISMTNPDGGHASAQRLSQLLEKYEGSFAVELFSPQGERRTFRKTDLNPETGQAYTSAELLKAMEQHTKPSE